VPTIGDTLYRHAYGAPECETIFEHSRNRWLNQDELRAKLTGWGTSPTGHAIRRKYRPRFKQRLADDRRRPRNKDIWRALKDAGIVGTEIATDQFIDRLIVMGITAAAGEGIGVDKDGIRNVRDQALWLGQHLGIKRSQVKLQHRVGAWAIEILNDQPFTLDENDVLTLPLTPELDEFLNAFVRHSVENAAFIFPSAEPPEPWTQVRKGGLPPTNDWAKFSLISSYHPNSENAVRKAIADGKMQPILDAVNYLAQTAFRINKPVLAFMQRREEPRILKLRAEADRLTRERELRKLSWSERQNLANLTSEITVWELDMMVANHLADGGRFSVPLQMDFRGRINPLPFFNFTRSDYIRALFLFDREEPIGEEGLHYLKSHVAETADGNKWSLVERPGNLDPDGRVAWTDANLELLRKIGNAVLRGEDDPARWEWVLETVSDPYQFIAACVELTQAPGPSFKTTLPLIFDATCSGLQHICAMMCAPEGRYVNLVPSNELSDFYSLVGATIYGRAYYKIPEHLRAVEEVHRADGGIVYKLPEIPKQELGLLRFFKDGNPFDRKIIKPPGMTYGYGSRAGGWQKTKRGRYRPKGMTEQA